MKRNLSVFSFCVVLSAAVFMGCGSANQLLVPTEITRPPVTDLSPPEPSRARVAVVDFSYTPPDEPKVIGRDNDRVRQIIWEGNPGNLMADLVAGSLSERGVPASRFSEETLITDNFSSVVKGTVRRFEVNIRRRNLVNVYVETTVEMNIFVSGPGVTAPWETSISSSSVSQEVIPLPDNVGKALSSVANNAADEAVRRLRERGAAGSSR